VVGPDPSTPLAEEGWWVGDPGGSDGQAGITGGRGGVGDEEAPAGEEIEEK
jgi:hypothetical protein